MIIRNLRCSEHQDVKTLLRRCVALCPLGASIGPSMLRWTWIIPSASPGEIGVPWMINTVRLSGMNYRPVCQRPASARAVRSPLKADVRFSFSFFPCFRIVGLQQIPKLFTNFRYPIMVIFEKADFIPFWRVAIAFTIFAILTYPKIWFLWINDPKTIRVIKNGIITTWFRFRICKHSISVRFNSEHLVYTAYREG
jgi:hypothetical protein